MDTSDENFNPNPREDANPLSILFFTYTIRMFRDGYSKTLDSKDIYNPIKADRSLCLGNRLEKKWKEQLTNNNSLTHHPSLLKALFKTFWSEILILGIIVGVFDMAVQICQPLVLGQFLDYFSSDSNMTQNEAFIYAGLFVMLYAFQMFTVNQNFIGSLHYGMRARVSCCALIYKKALRLHKRSLGDTGKIVNLLSNDVSRFEFGPVFIHFMWVGPTITLIIMGLLWKDSGYAGLIGIIPIFIVVLLQAYTGKLTATYRRKTAMKGDERIRLMDEIISGVQVIKMYAWEKPFSKLISNVRKLELKTVTKAAYVRALFMTFSLFTRRVSLYCALLTLSLTDQPLSASKVFVFAMYFNIVSQIMSLYFVRGVAELAELYVGIKRIQDFLLKDEFMPNSQLCNSSTNVDDNGISMEFQNATVKWNPESTEDALCGINVVVPKGSLLGIIGPVGSGKSTFLQTILGEIDITKGSIKVNGTISYASQEPWVFGATIRQNILFGQDYDQKRYNEIVEVCALKKDFKQFPNGDLTLVGERGASLSGGQKARINLARAVYRDADIYLLDDPLSAVDIHVGKQLYDECINGYLKNKTRILVTHQVYRLKNADRIIILDNGLVEAQGDFNSLGHSGSPFSGLLSMEKEETDEDKQDSPRYSRQVSYKSTSSLDEAKNEKNLTNDKEKNQIMEAKPKKFQEQFPNLKVNESILLKYLLAGGSLCAVLLISLLFLTAQLFASVNDYFVSYWTNIEEQRNVTLTENYLSTEDCIYIYTGLIIGVFVWAFSSCMLFYKLAMNSSKNLHNSMFLSVIRAPLRFFDATPSGAILNRFSKDIGNIDEPLPRSTLDAGQIVLMATGSLILVAVVNPYFLILVAFMAVCSFFMYRIYVRCSNNIKRLESMMRSPVFTHLNATMQGLTTVRAFGAQEILTKEFDRHQDAHSGAYFMFVSATSAFGFYLDTLSFIFTLVLTFSFLMFGEEFGITASKVGLAITQSTALAFFVQWSMRRIADVENQLVSVERIVDYVKLPSEKQPDAPKSVAEKWPNEGNIKFTNVTLRYDEYGPPVLNKLSFTICSRQKVGIVGRTGAGKSSLIAALFRLAIVEGKIEIDGIDTRDLQLQLLRSRISIIPQDPVLFSGTLRYNLDPFNEYPDDVLYRALENVELKDPSNTINRLEHRVMDRGSNYSVGQRQLICLARALVRNNKILLLDEATANVDPQTDAIIQKTIREKFAECTVLTIAHRLNTIMDSDRVLVMDAGCIAEFHHPYLLLQNSNSVFSKMVSETGKGTSEHLKMIAKGSYETTSLKHAS